MKIRLSASDAMVPGRTWTEKAELLHNLCYSGMTVFVDEPAWNDGMLEELLLLEERTGVRCCEFAFTGPLYGHLMDKDENVARAAIGLYKRSVAIANRLGAVTEMEYEYRPQDPLPLFDPYPVMPEEEVTRFVRIAEELGSLCQGGGRMLIEACNRYETHYLTTLGACRDMLEKADPAKTKNMGLIADFFHLAIEEADPARSVLDCAPWIRHVHLGDSNRLAPGKGHTDWKSIFRALKEIGYDGYMVLECGLDPARRVEELGEIREYLTRLEASV